MVSGREKLILPDQCVAYLLSFVNIQCLTYLHSLCTFIFSNRFHLVLLTECGKTFTCGLGSVGQLGHGGTKNLSTVSNLPPLAPLFFLHVRMLFHPLYHLLS